MNENVGPALPQGFTPLFGSINMEIVLAVVVFIIFVWWLIFTVVVTYHWFRYARDSWLTVPILALHLFISGWIFVFSTGGLH